MTDCDIRIHDLGCRRPGCSEQPGRWRLTLGKCAVGALALARSPRHVRVREESERGGRKAEIVDLQNSINIGGDGGTGGGGEGGVVFVGHIEYVFKNKC